MVSLDKPGSPMRRWALLAVIGLLFAVQIYAFHWGVITPDTVFQWSQALSGHYDNWHPPATAWLWHLLMPLGSGTAPVQIFYGLLYWSGIWLIADTLRRRGRHGGMIAVILCAALPIPFGQMGAILKDPLLAACCLLVTGLLVAFRDATGSKRIVATMLAVIVLLFASATRFNAMFATAPLLAAWLPDVWLSNIKRGAIALLASLLLLATGSWLIDTVALRPTDSQPVFSQVNFDIAGILAHGGANPYPNMDDASARRWTAHCYDPGQYNPTFREDCDTVEMALADYAAKHHRGAIDIWLRGIAASPLAYVRHRVDHLNRNWRFLVSAVPGDAVYIMTTDNDFGLRFTPNAATLAIKNAAQWQAASPLGRPATYLALAAGLLALAGGMASRRILLALAGSAICYGLGYGVFSVAPDMRYNLWTMLAATLALIMAWPDLMALRRSAKARLLLAALPVMLVMIAEIVAYA